MSEVISITSFRVAGEYFGIDTMKIQHILENCVATAVPLAKDYVRGVINNHGNMIPVIDFRVLIGAEPDESQAEASIMVVSSDETNQSLIGFKVDLVDEVFEIEEEKISKDVVLEVRQEVQKSFCGTISYDGKFIYRIDLDEITKAIEK